MDTSFLSKNIIYWIIGAVVLIGGAWLIIKPSTSTPAVPEDAFVITPSDHVKGSATASATLIEYADYQCPACASYFSTVTQLEQQMGDQVRLVYRHFPLIEIHNNALPSARAAEAAGRQGKFWEMSTLLYQKQSEWSEDKNAVAKFKGYAQELGLNTAQFETDYNDGTLIQKINADRAQALKLNLEGTPSFFLNGKKIQPPRDVAGFKRLISEATASASLK